jgi:hypothetical protein
LDMRVIGPPKGGPHMYVGRVRAIVSVTDPAL